MLRERSTELAALQACLPRVRAGSGQMVFVVGEAGIGKTSLIGTIQAGCRPWDPFLQTACEDFSTPEPLAILRDLGLASMVIEGSRLSFFSAVLASLTGEPTLLLVEDIHWADDASLDFLRYAGRRITDRPLLIVVTSRNDDAESRSRLRRLANDIPVGMSKRIDLAPLSVEAVRRMAGEAGMPNFPVHQLTGGNPLFVVELLASRGTTSASINDLILARADSLPDLARSLLDFCSLFPARVSDDVLATRVSDPAALDMCCDSGLLVRVEGAHQFRHELSRRAIECAVNPVHARQVHAEILQLLERSGANSARKLHHAAAGALISHIKALAPVVAREASASGSYREAAAALAFLEPHVGDLPRAGQGSFWRDYGQALSAIDPAASQEALGRSLAIFDGEGEREEVGRLCRAMALSKYLVGRSGRCRTICDASRPGVVRLRPQPAACDGLF
jgi:hypothetical protein